MRDRQTTRRAPLVRRLLAVTAAAAALVFAGGAWAQGYWDGPTHICSDPGFGVGPGMAPQEFSTPVWGEVACSDVTGTYCAGYVNPDPICIRVEYPTTVSIDVTWANVDSVLALIGPGGAFADDDGGPGTNSRLVATLVPGDYLLYAGTYSYGAAGSVAIALGDISWAPSPPPVVVYSSPPAWPVYRPVPLPFPRPHYHPSPPPRHVHHPAPPPHRAEPARPHHGHHPSPPPHRTEPAPPHRPTAPPHHADRPTAPPHRADRPTAPPSGRPTAPPPSARPGGGGDHDRGRGDSDRGRGGRDRGEGDRGRGGSRGDRGRRGGSRGRRAVPAPAGFQGRGR